MAGLVPALDVSAAINLPIKPMATRFKQIVCGAALLAAAASALHAQGDAASSALNSSHPDIVQAAVAPDAPTAATTTTTTSRPSVDGSGMLLVQASTAPALPSSGQKPLSNAATTSTTTAAPATVGAAPVSATEADSATENGGVGVREFQGDDVGQVLRLLARQAKINLVVSEGIQGTVTMRLEDVTALQAIDIIATSKGLSHGVVSGVHYIKTAAEREKEPTDSGSYQFSYAQVATPQALSITATSVASSGAAPTAAGGTMSSGSVTPNPELLRLIKSQLTSGIEPQFDVRTNTVFYRETKGNMAKFEAFLKQIDRPTKQVMIEARLVEVTANPKQAYGINWAGVVGSADAPQKVSYGTNAGGFTLNSSNRDVIGNFGKLATGSFAILSVPQMSVTLQALNEDADAEFLANPRVVTADNMPAKIEIVRAQPVPELGFNAQTATPIFNGFQDKTFGNTLLVKPSVNKDGFVTLSVKPTISNKVADQPFTFQGATVSSPVIDTRSLESNVLIKSGQTLAIGGLLQDEVRKNRTKVPVMGDVPMLGYLFQSRTNERVKRNLLVFVTPTILDQAYGTGLEDQVTGLHHSGEEYADSNGWRNNAKGAVRLVPTAQRQAAADYPVPGIPPAPVQTGGTRKARFLTSAKDRDF